MRRRSFDGLDFRNREEAERGAAVREAVATVVGGVRV